MELIKRLDHPNIVKVHEQYSDKKNYYLITEYVEGENISSYFCRQNEMTERPAALMVRQLISALLYTHSKNVFHRKLKFENIMISGDTVKILDTGFCPSYDNTHQGK
jgi:calcium-dependent protein kinase